MRTFVAFLAIVATIYAGECDKMCTDEWQPVCASNGRTYANQCDYEVGLCQSGFSIQKMGDGECREECQLACPKNIHEVCGSNGMTFANECLMNVANCLSRQFNKPQIALSFDGSCESSDCGQVMCTMDFSPVCGSNGFTFSNACKMETASCFLENAGLPALAKAFDGECASSPCAGMMCTMEFDPVCASNGITFPNPCAMGVASCYLESAGLSPLTVSQQGECAFPDDEGDNNEGDDDDEEPTGWTPVPWSEIIAYDHNQDNTITWSEFVDAMHKYNPHSNQAVELFGAIDLDNNNHITEEEHNEGIAQGVNIVGFADNYEAPPQSYNFFTTTAGIVVLCLSSLAVVILIVSVAFMCLTRQAVNSNGDFVELEEDDEEKAAEMQEVKSEKI